MKMVSGGVCAPKGYKANGIHCGIRKNKTKNDIALIVSETVASCAGVYTTNLVKGAPIVVTKKNISNGKAQAVVCNSGNANTCNANGIQIAEKMCEITANALGISPSDVVVASTGVIGQPLDITPIETGMEKLVGGLSENGSSEAVLGIMTTDTKPKEIAVEFEIDGKVCRLGGIAKGSGMIHPNMATMLVFITSDVAISSKMLETALKSDVKNTFNMVSVDGDTSTNDMVVVMANGKAGNREIIDSDADFSVFMNALNTVTVGLCKMIAGDGEGATKFIECTVSGAKNEQVAKVVAKSIICSSLVKTAMFGADANWGRILCAIGYSGADVDVSKVEVSFRSDEGEIKVCSHGAGVEFDETTAKNILLKSDIEILVDLCDGKGSAVAWGCDLSYDYVRINGDYRT